MTAVLNVATEYINVRANQDIDESATDFHPFAASQLFQHGRPGAIQGYLLDQFRQLFQEADFTDYRPVMISYYGLTDAGESSSILAEQGTVFLSTENIAIISIEPGETFNLDIDMFHSSTTALDNPGGTEVLPEESRRQLNTVLDEVFIAAEDEHFEPGKESEYSMRLGQLAKRSPESIWRFIKKRLAAPRQDVEVLGEMLRWTGRTEISGPLADKLSLLVAGLSHASSLVRDGAAVGLSHLEHPSAVHYLRKAAQREEVPELREDLLHIAESLGEQST